MNTIIATEYFEISNGNTYHVAKLQSRIVPFCRIYYFSFSIQYYVTAFNYQDIAVDISGQGVGVPCSGYAFGVIACYGAVRFNGDLWQIRPFNRVRVCQANLCQYCCGL